MRTADGGRARFTYIPSEIELIYLETQHTYDLWYHICTYLGGLKSRLTRQTFNAKIDDLSFFDWLFCRSVRLAFDILNSPFDESSYQKFPHSKTTIFWGESCRKETPQQRTRLIMKTTCRTESETARKPSSPVIPLNGTFRQICRFFPP